EIGPSLVRSRDGQITAVLSRAELGKELSRADITLLFGAEGRDFDHIVALADDLRQDRVGDTITYVVNRNINYTNICLHHCGFCAFSKASTQRERVPADNIGHEELTRRAIVAHERGANAVCLQGGIHPSYDGHTYRAIRQAVK